MDEYPGVHLIGGYPAWFNELKNDSDSDMRNFILNGVAYGFAIVDDVQIPSYYCNNYKLATEGKAKEFFDDLFCTELSEFKYVKAIEVPHCVHAMVQSQRLNMNLDL